MVSPFRCDLHDPPASPAVRLPGAGHTAWLCGSMKRFHIRPEADTQGVCLQLSEIL